MASHENEIETVIPDLRDLPVDRLAELGSSALAHSSRSTGNGSGKTVVPLSSFQARI